VSISGKPDYINAIGDKYPKDIADQHANEEWLGLSVHSGASESEDQGFDQPD
jgi:hypothetical protein